MGRVRRFVASALGAAALALAPAAAATAAGASPAGNSWASSRLSFLPLAGTTLSADGIGAYRGSFDVSPDGQGLRLVNTVDFEDYLLGISEMPPSWPRAALEAQAVAARTYALWSVLAHKGLGPHDPQICASDDCQVYRGLQREAEPGAVNWSTAVRATSGDVLLYHGLVIEALYGSSDGGRTTSGGVPWLPSVSDPDDQASPLHQWSWSAPLSSLSGALGVPSGWTLAGLVSQSGGDVAVTLQAADGSGQTTTETLGAGAFVQLLNTRLSPVPGGLPLALPSWRFRVSTSGTSAVVQGWGFGHGMGMSQYGALGKALRGMSAASILASYYGPAGPVALNGAQEPSTIRVGLADGLPAVTVEATGNFVMVDGTGRAVAVGHAGQWRVQPDGAGVRVDSSAGFDPVGAATPPPPPVPATAPTEPAPTAVPALVTPGHEALVGLSVPVRHHGRGTWPWAAGLLLGANLLFLGRFGLRRREAARLAVRVAAGEVGRRAEPAQAVT